MTELLRSNEATPDSLRDWLGNIDIYLFDQLLKGRIRPGMRVLDAGCGSGRNLVYLLRSGVEVFGVDASADAIAEVQELAARLEPGPPRAAFRVEQVEAMSFPDDYFDVVISSAVLHFASNEQDFDLMLREMWRVLAHGGLLFARLASTIGIEEHLVHIEGRRYRLPDGSDRFLVDEALLLDETRKLAGTLVEPIKTVNVQNQRCMTTWCLRKSG